MILNELRDFLNGAIDKIIEDGGDLSSAKVFFNQIDMEVGVEYQIANDEFKVLIFKNMEESNVDPVGNGGS